MKAGVDDLQADKLAPCRHVALLPPVAILVRDQSIADVLPSLRSGNDMLEGWAARIGRGAFEVHGLAA